MHGVSQPVKRLLSSNNGTASSIVQYTRGLHTTCSLAIRSSRAHLADEETPAGKVPAAQNGQAAADSARSKRTPSARGRSRPIVNKKKKDDNGLKPYSRREMIALKENYTNDQLGIIKRGEKAIPVEDLEQQARIRTDYGAIRYLDDFSHYRPVVDSKMPRPVADPKRDLQVMEYDEEHEKEGDITLFDKTTDKFGQRLLKERLATLDAWAVKQGFKNRADMWKATCAEKGANVEVGWEKTKAQYPDPMVEAVEQQVLEAMLDDEGSPYVAPTLGKIREMEELYPKDIEPDSRDPEGRQTKLMKVTGKSLDEIFGLRTKALVKHRVVNMTRLGRVQSMYVLAIAGNNNGMLGIGEGKAQEPEDAIRKANFQAIKSMKPIQRYEDRTIYGEVEAKVSASVVKLQAKKPGMSHCTLIGIWLIKTGYGLRCQHLIFEMCRAAGISDIAARVPRSRNKMNTIKATYQALLSQRLPDEVARGLGKKLVDVRKVYYGGDQRLSQDYYRAISDVRKEQLKEKIAEAKEQRNSRPRARSSNDADARNRAREERLRQSV